MVLATLGLLAVPAGLIVQVGAGRAYRRYERGQVNLTSIHPTQVSEAGTWGVALSASF